MTSERAWLLCCHLGFLMRVQSDIEGDCSLLKVQLGSVAEMAHLYGLW